MEYLTINEYIKFAFKDINAFVFKVPVKEILPLYYVAVRGRDSEEGAVQRVLSKGRIDSIAEYVLKGHMFLNTFILNWANKEADLQITDEYINIPKLPASMQIIDGQHRLEGIKRACSKDTQCGETDILIVLTNRLETKFAAEIFLNINSEQKQVPKSLVYDLFGEIRDPDYNIDRAREIAVRLNDDIESAFYQCVKLPGTINKGKVDLSTMVTALKDQLKDNAVFDNFNITAFELQYRMILNYHQVIREAYGDKWLSNDNPFFTNAGYFALMKFFCDKMIPQCAFAKTFEKEHIKQLLDFENEELLYRADLKNVQGKEQRQIVYNFLNKIFTKDVPSDNGYKV